MSHAADPRLTRRATRLASMLLPTIVGLAPLGLPSCENGGHFTVLGYTTQPNYRADIRTIRVPVFKNSTYRDSVRQGLEFDLTKAVVREIEAKTPYKVVGPGCDADTELTGTIVTVNKNILNRNELNEVREGEMVIGVEIRWQDLRSGEWLSRRQRPPGQANSETPTPGPTPGKPPPPVLVTAQGNFIPELGQSPTTALQTGVNRMAVQIVSLMEQPW